MISWTSCEIVKNIFNFFMQKAYKVYSVVGPCQCWLRVNDCESMVAGLLLDP